MWSDGEPLTPRTSPTRSTCTRTTCVPASQNYHAAGWDTPAWSAEQGRVRHDRTDVVLQGCGPLHVLLHPAPARLRTDRAGQLPRRLRSVQPEGYDNVPSVSSGPFFIAEYKVGEFVRLERNTFWKGPRPGDRRDRLSDLQERDDAIATALQTGRSTSRTSPRPTSSTPSRPPRTSTRWSDRSRRSPRSG